MDIYINKREQESKSPISASSLVGKRAWLEEETTAQLYNAKITKKNWGWVFTRATFWSPTCIWVSFLSKFWPKAAGLAHEKNITSSRAKLSHCPVSNSGMQSCSFPRGESMCSEGVMVGICLWQTQQRKQTTATCMHQEWQHQGDHQPSPRGASMDIQLQTRMAASICTEAATGFWPPSHLVPFPLLSRDRFSHHTSKAAILPLFNWYLHLPQTTTHTLHINLLITSSHLEERLKSIFSEILLGFFYSKSNKWLQQTCDSSVPTTTLKSCIFPTLGHI